MSIVVPRWPDMHPNMIWKCPSFTECSISLFAYRAAIKRAQAQLETFEQNAPAYNSSLFQGKGIVIMAGGLTYFVPAWINIHMLRKAGMHDCLSLLMLRLCHQCL